ncbi:Holliday junction branch migration protein RuvA [Marinobacteraceae bacterium S3BR75-40.1]
MISRIHGQLLEKSPGVVLVDCAGLGYEIDVPYTTFFELPDVGQPVTLQCHLVIREDAHVLYGFAARGDRDLFRLLIKTSGVGPKLALAILSGLEANQFVAAVEADDVNALVKIPGIGKKTAQRLLIEMRDRIKQYHGDGAVQPTLTTANEPKQAQPRADEEAEAALIALGYKPQEAAKAISRVAEPGMDSQTLIRLALKSMLS